MTALLVVLTIIGCFGLARFYGMLASLGALGLCWGVFAWFPQAIPTIGPVLFLGVAALLGLGYMKARRTA